MQNLIIAVFTLYILFKPLSVWSSNSPLGEYQSKGALTGKINSTGSDTLANLMSFWADEFKHRFPNVEFELHSEGSTTAPPALLAGTSNLAPMSRKMRAAELALFQQKFGYQPLAIKVAMDAIAVFVHRDNPLDAITIEQLDRIFSEHTLCGRHAKIVHWGEAGLTGQWAGKKITVLGRDPRSGSYSFFKEISLCGGDFSLDMEALPGSGSIVQAISNNHNAIGFSGMGYKTSGVRTLPIIHNGIMTLPNISAETNWDYPLTRFLYLYINKTPSEPLPEVLREFILLVLSNTGQHTVELDGYAAVSETIIEENLQKLAIPFVKNPALH
ncbi:phosphate ABC transporter substrate-binding protein [Paraglaciecola sp.]|uniref:PstS family phosphate ABC transporter substrate-binding protein n=1 Tax=Paraglaciecola sp. TaxID=1920173 RepID=UPI0030F3F69F